MCDAKGIVFSLIILQIGFRFGMIASRVGPERAVAALSAAANTASTISQVPRAYAPRRNIEGPPEMRIKVTKTFEEFGGEDRYYSTEDMTPAPTPTSPDVKVSFPEDREMSVLDVIEKEGRERESDYETPVSVAM